MYSKTYDTPHAKAPSFARLGGTALILMAATLASCTEGGGMDNDGQTDGVAIAFDAGNQQQVLSRAAVVDAGSLSGSLGVTAYMNIAGTDHPDLKVFNNEKVDATNYTYANPQYWPAASDRKIRFFAWWPYEAPTETPAITTTTEGGSVAGLSFPYTIPSLASDQNDLLYAVTKPLNNTYDYTTTPATQKDAVDKVPLSFRHALARIRFSAKLETDQTGYTAKIKSISIYAINNGTFTIGTDVDATGTWAVNRTPKAEELRGFLTPFTLTPGSGLKASDCNYSGSDNSAAIQLKPGNDFTAISATNEYLFMIPQRPPYVSLSKPSQLQSPVLYVEYQLDNGLTGDQWLYTNKTASFSLADLVLTEGQTVTGDDSKDPYVWETGKPYHYQITITTNDVTLNILPTDWIDGNNGNDKYTFQ